MSRGERRTRNLKSSFCSHNRLWEMSKIISLSNQGWLFLQATEKIMYRILLYKNRVKNNPTSLKEHKWCTGLQLEKITKNNLLTLLSKSNNHKQDFNYIHVLTVFMKQKGWSWCAIYVENAHTSDKISKNLPSSVRQWQRSSHFNKGPSYD